MTRPASATPGATGGGTVTGALAAIQHAVHDRDVRSMCGLLLPDTAVHAHGSAQQIKSALAAQVQDCETGFGRRGEFAGYAPLATAKVTRIKVQGKLASVQVATDRGPGSLRFLNLDGYWRMLVAGS
jgi:hypothetical protein